MVLQGATAWHLLRTSTHMQEGESVVVHAGAGGVGTIAIQLAKRWGAGRVIASASSEEKRALALELGADVAIDANAEDLKAAIEEANGGNTVDVVLEMVGGTTFDSSLAALAPFGRLAIFGMAGRELPEPIQPGALISTSRGVIGFWLAHCMRDPQRLVAEPVAELLEMVAKGELKPVVGGTYPLSEARRAHEDMRARKTTGKLVLDTSAELAYIAIETAGGPHVTPVLHGRAGERLWFLVARGTLKARVIAKRPDVGVYVEGAALAGRATLLDPMRPHELGPRVPELACALPSLGRGNELELLGFARDALRAPGRMMPSNMLLVSVEVTREWAVERPEADGDEAVLGWLGPHGPLALPASWDPGSRRARVGWPGAVPAGRRGRPPCASTRATASARRQSAGCSCAEKDAYGATAR